MNMRKFNPGVGRWIDANCEITKHRYLAWVAASKQKAIDADCRSSKWLADGNAYAERGDKVRAEKCYAKSQFWLDRYNKYAGNL